MTRTQVCVASIGWRIPKLTLKRRNGPINRTFAPAGDTSKGIQGSGTKGGTLGRL
jgi:hypothetical protein